MVGSFVRKAACGLALVLAAVALAGCDKCGHFVHPNAPAIQHACSDDGAQSR